MILHFYSAFPWCGYSINMKDLSIMVDYSRYNDSGEHFYFLSGASFERLLGIKSTLTVDRGRHPGTTFIYKLLQ